MSRTITGLPDDRPFWLRDVSYQPLAEHARHRHDHCSITLILAGAIEEGAHSAMHQYGAFSVVTKPAGVPHHDRYGPLGARTFQLAFTSEHARDLCPGMSYAWRRGGPIARAMLDLLRHERAGDTPEGLDNGIIDVLSHANVSANESLRGRNAKQLGAIREFLDAETCAHISVRKLADEARMHPVALARAFRRQYGCSITDYVRRRRVVNACELIGAGDDPLAMIAVNTGFADQPHFTRAFKNETGTTPAVFRHLAADPRSGSNRSRQSPAQRLI